MPNESNNTPFVNTKEGVEMKQAEANRERSFKQATVDKILSTIVPSFAKLVEKAIAANSEGVKMFFENVESYEVGVDDLNIDFGGNTSSSTRPDENSKGDSKSEKFSFTLKGVKLNMKMRSK